MTTNKTDQVINQLVSLIRTHYWDLPSEKIPQKVRDQIIPMLISLFFKGNPMKLNQRGFSISGQPILESESQNQTDRLSNLGIDLEKIAKILTFYLSLQAITRRVKRECIIKLYGRKVQVEKAIKFLLFKSKKSKVGAVIQKLILNSRLTKLQFEGAKVISKLFKRKFLNNAKLFLQNLKEPLLSEVSALTLEKVKQFTITVNALSLRRLRSTFKQLESQTNQYNSWRRKMVCNIALKSQVSIQNSLWRIRTLADRNSRIQKFVNKMTSFLAKSTHQRIVFFFKIFSSRKRVSKAVQGSQKNVLAEVTNNLVTNRLFKNKMASFVGIQEYAFSKYD